VRFANFFSGGFITAIVVNPPERKLTKRTSVQCGEFQFMLILDLWFLRFNPVVVVGSDYDFLVKSILRHCGSPAAILKVNKNRNDFMETSF
jgi:hypothetical protein